MVAEFEKQNPDIKVETEVIGYDDYFIQTADPGFFQNFAGRI